MRITVTISGGDLAATTRVKERLSSRHYDSFLKPPRPSTSTSPMPAGWAYPDSAPVEFLIITPPQFVADLAPFVEWKTSTGYNVSVVTTDVTGTTTTAIKSYITGLYNGPTPPVYILMIGDSPSPLATYTPSGRRYRRHGSALCPDGRRSLPGSHDRPLAHRRLDRAGQHARQDPPLRAAHRRQLGVAQPGALSSPVTTTIPNGVTTHEDVIAQLMEPAPNSAECELWYGDTQNPTTQQLIADLNTGRAWAVYSAHCGPSGMVRRSAVRQQRRAQPRQRRPVPARRRPLLLTRTSGRPTPMSSARSTVIQPTRASSPTGAAPTSTYWDEDDWLEKGFFDALVRHRHGRQPSATGTGCTRTSPPATPVSPRSPCSGGNEELLLAHVQPQRRPDPGSLHPGAHRGDGGCARRWCRRWPTPSR